MCDFKDNSNVKIFFDNFSFGFDFAKDQFYSLVDLKLMKA